MKIIEANAMMYGAYGQHLKNLDEDDKYTRFGYLIKDSTIDQIILDMIYSQDSHYLFVALEGEEILGFGHFAREDNDWELAVSVNKYAQGQGIADKLMTTMISWGKTRGITSVFMHCIADNKKIQHLALKHGLRTVERSGPDITAKVKLPDPTALDYTADFMREQRDLTQQILTIQQKILRNLNPLLYVEEHRVDK